MALSQITMASNGALTPKEAQGLDSQRLLAWSYAISLTLASVNDYTSDEITNWLISEIDSIPSQKEARVIPDSQLTLDPDTIRIHRKGLVAHVIYITSAINFRRNI